MIQELIRVGDEAAILIPEELIDNPGWKIGDNLSVEVNKELGIITIRAV